MAEAVVLNASKRERAGTGGARATRRANLLPGVVYGSNKEAVAIEMDPRPIIKEMKSVEFYSKMFDLDIDGKKEKVFAKEVQKHVINELPLHIDFLRVDEKSKMHVNVPIHFVNEEASPAIKRGALLNVVHHEVSILALPSAIPAAIDFDLTGLEVGDSITAKDIKLPKGVELFHIDADETIATVVAPSRMKSQGADASEEEEAEAESAEEEKSAE